jgi:hypothetical protein
MDEFSNSVNAKGNAGLNFTVSGRLSQIVISSDHSFLVKGNMNVEGNRSLFLWVSSYVRVKTSPEVELNFRAFATIRWR